jgi:hypothetical protein
MNDGFPFEPLPRWVILPGDPEPLKDWLRARAVEDGTTTEMPPPDYEDQRDQEAS